MTIHYKAVPEKCRSPALDSPIHNCSMVPTRLVPGAHPRARYSLFLLRLDGVDYRRQQRTILWILPSASVTWWWSLNKECQRPFALDPVNLLQPRVGMAPILAGDEVLDLRPDAAQAAHPPLGNRVCDQSAICEASQKCGGFSSSLFLSFRVTGKTDFMQPTSRAAECGGPRGGHGDLR